MATHTTNLAIYSHACYIFGRWMDRESTYLISWQACGTAVVCTLFLCLLLSVSVLFQFRGSPRPDCTAGGRAGQDGGAPQDAEAGHVGRESPERVSDPWTINTRGKSTMAALFWQV